MDAPSFDRAYGLRLTLDICHRCQGMWFDEQELLQLTPGATLQLMAAVAEDRDLTREPWNPNLRCPRCSRRLAETPARLRELGYSVGRDSSLAPCRRSGYLRGLDRARRVLYIGKVVVDDAH